MAYVEGVNVSSVMNRQLHSIGNRQGRAKMALKRIASGGVKGTKVSPSHATRVCKVAHVNGRVPNLYALPYDSDDNSVFFYRSGSDNHGDAVLASNMSRFKQGTRDANVWCLLLGRFEGDDLVIPEHDNRPDGSEADEAVAAS